MEFSPSMKSHRSRRWSVRKGVVTSLKEEHGRCHVVESLMRVRQVPQLKSCGGDDFAPRLHG